MQSEFRSWSDVRVFLAVYREGSTLAASRKLGIAQPTVARRIDVLENETGLTLFERDTRGFKPTKCATDLYSAAVAMEASAGQFWETSQGLSKPQPIRITSPDAWSESRLDIFSRFLAANPGVRIEFVHSIRLLNLLNGEADIAIRVSNDQPDEALICRKIGTEHMALYGGRRYADKFGLPKSMNDFEGHQFVTFEHEGVTDVLHNWLMRHVSNDQIVSSFSELDLMYASIKSGLGLGLVHSRFGDTEDGLIRCFGNIEELARPVRMLVAPDAYRRTEVRAFTKYFAPRFAAWFDD